MSDMTEPVKAFEEFWSKMTDDQNKARTELLQPQDVAALAFHSGVVWAASNALEKMKLARVIDFPKFQGDPR